MPLNGYLTDDQASLLDWVASRHPMPCNGFGWTSSSGKPYAYRTVMGVLKRKGWVDKVEGTSYPVYYQLNKEAVEVMGVG